MNEKPNIVKNYLDGSGNDSDNEIVKKHLAGEESRSSLYSFFEEYWNTMHPADEEEVAEDEILGRIYHQIKKDEYQSLQEEKRRIGRKIFQIFSKVAAVLFIPLVATLMLNYSDIFSDSREDSYTEIYAPLGAHLKFVLPDGSSGFLNSGSSIKYAASFSGKSREVMLSGEAYFDVKTDPKHPFVVSTDRVKVVAHGTSFNVNSYSEDADSKVALAKGVVEVFSVFKGESRSVGILKPGEMCVIDSSRSNINIVNVVTSEISSWKNGQLIFRNEPFKEVIKKLNRRYNANIVIKDSILNTYSFMATFDDETLDVVLNLLTLSTPISISKHKNAGKGREIEIYYKNKPKLKPMNLTH